MLHAQDLSRIPDSADQRYFDFWPGAWVRERDGRVDASDSAFIVTRLPSGALLETWRLKRDSVVGHSTGLRAFDKAWNRWMFTWASAEGHFQQWEGRRLGGGWYFYREFDLNGDRYLSRQGWLPDGADRVMRVSEKSYDGGVTWQLRFREHYRRAQ